MLTRILKICLINIILIPNSFAGPTLRSNEEQIRGIRGPEQVHVSYGDTPQEMVVVWSTDNISSYSSLVSYGLSSKKLNMKAYAADAVLNEGNPDGLKQLHRSVLTVCLL